MGDVSDWDRVCGPSSALVFRIWRQAGRNWWRNTQASDAIRPGAEHGAIESEGIAAESRFGDKLIGSAAVGLEVLRRAVDTREGQSLREIDGWYHVLDELQRPQGQIKVSGVFCFLLKFEPICIHPPAAGTN